MAPGRSRAATSRKIVNYTWAGFISATRTNVPAASKVFLGSFSLATAFEETLTRTRGHIYVGADQLTIVEEQYGAFGLIRVTDLAIAAGAGSIPGPVTDADDDGWVVWQGISQTSNNTVVANDQRYEINSKAMRVIREGQQLAVMVENAHAADGFDISVAIRALARFRS